MTSREITALTDYMAHLLAVRTPGFKNTSIADLRVISTFVRSVFLSIALSL